MNDLQWKSVQVWFRPKKKPFLKRLREGGRPRRSDRQCLEAIIWSARTGMSWSRLPAQFGKRRTILSRLDQWQRSRLLEKFWLSYLEMVGATEREELRLALNGFNRKPTFWRLTLQGLLNVEYPPRLEGGAEE